MSEVPPREALSVEVGEDAVSSIGIGIFDRPDGGPLAPLGGEAVPLAAVRRHGGGKAVLLGPGIVRVAFRFPMDGTVTPDAERLLNRAVRPVLRALRTLTPLAHYFGRDVVSLKVAGRRQDVGAVGFAHDAEAGTGIFEAFLGVDRAPRADLVPLCSLLPDLSSARLRDALARAFAAEGAHLLPLASLPPIAPGPGWDVVRETPFARIGAAASPPCVGGDFFASRDFLEPLNASLRELGPGADASAVRALFAEGPRDGRVLIGIPGAVDLAEPLLLALAAAETRPT